MEDQSDKARNSNQIKVIMVGSMAVGKTCLIAHYQSGKFLSDLPSTSGSSYVQIKKVINGKKYNLNLWDTAGQEKYDSLTKIFTKNANIIILVYSIVDKKSFAALDKWLNLVKETNNEEDFVLGIAANKSDLYKQYEVSDNQGKEYAKKNKAIWKSTSAKEGDKGIEELIDELLRIYLETKRNNINSDNIQLGSEHSKSKDHGCCKGGNKKKKKGMAQNDRNYSKVSNLSNTKDEEEDF